MSKLRHCGILCFDLELTSKLFKDVFGFKEIDRGVVMGDYAQNLFNLINFHLTWIKLKDKGSSTLLELWKIKNMLPIEIRNFSHIAITVKNIDKIYNDLKERKIETLSKPIKNKDNIRLFFFIDYDKNIFEVVENRKLKD